MCFVILFCCVLLCVSFARGYDFTIQENGLQIDQPPEIGSISVVQIIIMENDNVEGIIEFDPKFTDISGKLSWLPLTSPNCHIFSVAKDGESYIHFFFDEKKLPCICMFTFKTVFSVAFR